MINSKKDFKDYLFYDEIARFGKKVTFYKKMKTGKMWRFNVLLRKCEYYQNKHKLLFLITFFKLKKIELLLGWDVPINVCDKGLCIVHYGPVIINSGAKIGKNCRIHVGVNIGSNGGGKKDTPTIGENVYIGPGAKIFGKIEIGNNCVIGANSVVNKSFAANHTIAGIPAKIISKNNSERFIKKIERGI